MTTVTAAEKAIQAALTLVRPLLQDQIDAWAKFGTCQTLPLMAKSTTRNSFQYFQLNQTYLGILD
jgi:hypothetical protein